jgi:hypothetical protein
LYEADARHVEEAFQAKLTAINGQSNNASVRAGYDMPQAKPANGDVSPATSAAIGQPAAGIDKHVLAHPKPRRS